MTSDAAPVTEPKSQHKNPIIIIPGCMGSKMEMKLENFDKNHWWCSKNADWFLVWINVEMFVPELVDCFKDYVSMTWNGKYPQNKPGVSSRVIPGIDGIEYLQPTLKFIEGYFDKMVKKFTENDYQKSKDLFALPYDFRVGAQNLTNWFIELKQTIQLAYETNGQQKVTILTHSMGGKIFTYFMSQSQQTQEWKDKYIQQWIPIAPALGGSFEPLETTIWGIDFGDPLVSKLKMREFQRTFTMMYYMYPFEDLDWEEPVIITDDRNYYARKEDYLDMMTELQFPKYSSEMLERQWEEMVVIDSPMVPTYIIFGNGTDTNCQAKFNGPITSDDYTIETCSGDGTVVEKNVLAMCNNWKKDHYVSCEGYEDKEHVSMVEDDEVINRVWSLLNNY
ncbi:phosphatidylcholine-sterol acyltransferase [Anaeramoeba flamelloides]|uniref:Phosphatidylcholine-sterol acyltransferase n=1 Tax=Anaeramoeba flamelloides TaxID=1746091 RepID=A0AAV7YPP5_9EUKA|nr:phosphatidylcholine-sterol acyltransferase [Anaeramoeba flamelloides]